MSALGHEQTSPHVRVMSVLPLKADIHQRGLHVRLVPLADISQAARLTAHTHTSTVSVVLWHRGYRRTMAYEDSSALCARARASRTADPSRMGACFGECRISGST